MTTMTCSIPGVVLIGSLAVAGCTATRSTEAVSATQPSAPPWTPALSPEQARRLTPDEAKAILVARAALEQQAKESGFPSPNIMAYKVTGTAVGWEVHVSYVGAAYDGKVVGAPGYFSVVYIDHAWNVTRIVGGA
jgi:hypothetical protein